MFVKNEHMTNMTFDVMSGEKMTLVEEMVLSHNPIALIQLRTFIHCPPVHVKEWHNMKQQGVQITKKDIIICIRYLFLERNSMCCH